jgi:hypothetical protein
MKQKHKLSATAELTAASLNAIADLHYGSANPFTFPSGAWFPFSGIRMKTVQFSICAYLTSMILGPFNKA